MLNQLEGAFESEKASSKVIVIAATNYRDRIDAAALRRFGLKIEVRVPNSATRLKIISSTLANFADGAQELMEQQQELVRLAEMSEGLTVDSLKKAIIRGIKKPYEHVFNDIFLTRKKIPKAQISDLRAEILIEKEELDTTAMECSLSTPNQENRFQQESMPFERGRESPNEPVSEEDLVNDGL